MKVLIARDQSHCSTVAFESVLNRVWPADCQFMVCSVVPDFLASACGLFSRTARIVCWVFKTSRKKSRNDLSSQAAWELKRAFPHVEASQLVKVGEAADMIVKTAVKWDADLLVLGFEQAPQCGEVGSWKRD